MATVNKRLGNLEAVTEAEVERNYDAFWIQFTNEELEKLATKTASPELLERAEQFDGMPLPQKVRAEVEAIMEELEAGGDPYIPELEVLQ